MSGSLHLLAKLAAYMLLALKNIGPIYVGRPEGGLVKAIVQNIKALTA